ncbi:AfsR/SARP family transcriptional regulator [Nonomuraea sp. NPDC050310]|uniref:AfsR/SARP family transcriptional regulator n=1 Tax=Nonomuraea sp. NPDC050310 TaxID=3154935 RepID=UPI0033CE1B5C
MEIFDDEHRRRVVPPGRKQRALLATLVIKAGQVLSSDRLIAELWGANPPVTAVNSLQATVARLRRLMDGLRPGPGDWAILTQESGYVMRHGPVKTDADRFLELSDQGRAMVAADPGRAATLLRQGLDLWRGLPLEDAICGDVCATFAVQLEERRLSALEALHDANLRLGRHHEIIAALEGLIGEHPFRERFHDLLMVALYRCGRQAEALSIYERLRARLGGELGLEPSPALQRRVVDVLTRAIDLDGTWPRRTEPRHTDQRGTDQRGTEHRREEHRREEHPYRDHGGDESAIISGLFCEVGHLRHRLEALTKEHNALLDRVAGLFPAFAAPERAGE